MASEEAGDTVKMKKAPRGKFQDLQEIESTGQPGLVSVIVPTYNRGYCVNKSIESALTQTYRDLEVIVIDDGSTDNTREVIAAAFAGESRVRYVCQSNGGVSVARNHGIRLARGEFMALLDSDDIWKPWKIELQVRTLQKLPSAGMIWTDMEAVTEDGVLLAPTYLRKMYLAYESFPHLDLLFSNSYPLSGLEAGLAKGYTDAKVYVGDIFSPMILGSLVHTSTVLIRRERLAQVGYFVKMRGGGEDYDFHLRTCHKGAVAFIDVSSIFYRVGCSDQITELGNDFYFARGYLRSIRPFLQVDEDRIRLSWRIKKVVQANAYGWIGRTLFARGKRKVARKFLATSLTYRLWQPRVLLISVRAIMPNWFDTLALRGYRAVKGFVKRASVRVDLQ